jgi:hypothetical protein
MAAVRHIINPQEIRGSFLGYGKIKKKGVIQYKSAAKVRNKYLPGDKKRNAETTVGLLLRYLEILQR